MRDAYINGGRLWVSHDHTCYTDLCRTLHKTELREANYKQITAKLDDDFLQQKLRAAALDGVKLKGIQDNSLVFEIRSANFSDNDTTYVNMIRFKEWDTYVNESSMNPIERARTLLFKGNLELHCTCPSFLFWGYQYLLTQIDAALVPETRPPVKKNPNHRGIVCKHLRRSISSLPFYSGDLARYIKANHTVVDAKPKVADIKSKKADEIRNDPDAEVEYNEVI